MEEYFNSKKYIILLVIVCLLFTIMITKIFDYLPKPIDNEELNSYSQSSYKNIDINSQNYNQETIQDEEATVDEENEEEEEEEEEEEVDNTEEVDLKHKSGHIDFYQNSNNFEEIPAPKGSAEEIIEAQ